MNYMKKLFTLLTMLLIGIGSMWATLSSNTIAKSGNVTDTWSISSALPTDNWTAMGDNTPAGVTALGSYTAYSRTQDITLSDEGALFITFLYSTGSHQLEILGVDLLDSDDKVVRSDYHYGKTGTLLSNNIYIIDHIESGNYKIRFIINDGVSNSFGNITVKHANIKTASSFANITQWYFIRIHSNQNNYMYYNSGATPNIGFGGTQNNAHYLWGFVKDTDGIRIYNKAAGSSVAIDNATPCTLSASGQTFTLGTGSAGNNGAAAGAYFSLYKNPERSATSRSYLNYQSAIKRWGSDDEGSAFMIDEQTFDAPFVEASEGKIYTIKANYPNNVVKYFSNNGNGKDLDFNNTANNGVNDYWILRSSGNGQYPWRFESGRGDGNFLSNNSSTEGLTNTGVFLQINTYIMGNNSYFELRGSNAGDASSSSIVNLGTWSGANGNKGFGKYGVGCWTSTGHWRDANWTSEYNIEEVTGVDVYTVVSNINAGGVTKTVYTGKAKQTNGGFYILSSTPSASDFTAISVTDYTAGDIVVDEGAKTITVNYTANITYTLTDVNGAEYTWSASGTFGTSPTITGCYGLTVSNEEWNEEGRSYTADIAFPFPVSSNNITNWTFIRQFATSYVNAKFYWYAKNNSKVYVNKGVYPTNGNNTSYEWAITPSCSSGVFTFTIKNHENTTFITYTSGKTNTHTDAITLTSSGTALEYVCESNYYRWAIPSSNQRLSINSSSDGKGEQELGVYTNHAGTAVEFEEVTNFSTLMANLKTAYNNFNQYLVYINTHPDKYTEAVEGTLISVYNTYNATTSKVVNDSPQAYLTATEFNTYTDAFNSAINGLRYVVPSFFRVKNLDGTKYAKADWQDYTNYIQLDFSAGGTDAGSIFYLNGSNNIISYYSGSYLFSINHTKPLSYGSNYLCTYEFLPGSEVGHVYVHVVNNPSGWGGNEKYWIANDTKIGRGTEPTANSDFLIEPVTSLPVTLKASALGYATFCCPVPVKIPSGVEAFVSKIEDNTIKLFRIENFKDASDNVVIPANTAVMLHNQNFNSIDETFSFEIAEYSGEGITDNGFYGTIAAESMVAGKTYYSLRTWKVNDVPTKVGFATKTSGSLAGFKAWICEEGQSARNFTIVFDSDSDPTGIIEALGLQNANVEIYDLNGRKLSSYKRGINIVNGKKVMVK